MVPQDQSTIWLVLAVTITIVALPVALSLWTRPKLGSGAAVGYGGAFLVVLIGTIWDVTTTTIGLAEVLTPNNMTQLKNFENKLNDVIEAQKYTREVTKDAAQKSEQKKEADIAIRQEAVADKTADLQNQPLPIQQKLKESLEKAHQAMKKAMDDLNAKGAATAVSKQDQALEGLKDAMREVGEKIARVEKRQADIAKLEEAPVVLVIMGVFLLVMYMILALVPVFLRGAVFTWISDNSNKPFACLCCVSFYVIALFFWAVDIFYTWRGTKSLLKKRALISLASLLTGPFHLLKGPFS